MQKLAGQECKPDYVSALQDDTQTQNMNKEKAQRQSTYTVQYSTVELSGLSIKKKLYLHIPHTNQHNTKRWNHIQH